MSHATQFSPSAWRRLASSIMALVVVATTSPSPVFAGETLTPPMPPKPFVQPSKLPANAKTGPHHVEKIVPRLSFSKAPSDLELSQARVFADQLIPMTGKELPGENAALAKALLAFKAKDSVRDVSDLKEFLSQFPQSRWAPSLQLALGTLRFKTGFLTESMALFQAAWKGAKAESADAPRTVASRAVAQLLMINARLGMMDKLQALLDQVGNRAFFGADEMMVVSARQGLSSMKNSPGRSFKCGPNAIENLLSIGKPALQRPKFLEDIQSTKHGTNLEQVKEWADQAGLKYQVAKRSPGAEVIVPSIMHWKEGHFAAVTEKKGDAFILKDVTFDFDRTLGVLPEALETESDGFFLVPAGKLPSGWSPVSKDEAKLVWGKGVSTSTNHQCFPQGTSGCGATCCSIGGPMAEASAWKMQATLHIVDTPLKYSPPLGPQISFVANYNHLEGNQPTTFAFPNFGMDWTFNWVSYMTVDPMTSVWPWCEFVAAAQKHTHQAEASIPQTSLPRLF